MVVAVGPATPPAKRLAACGFGGSSSVAEFPYMPLWTDAYIADTQHLTAAEHGAYLLLLMAAWRSPECDLPSDPRRLTLIARMTPDEWAECAPVVLRFFDEDGGRLTQKRLLRERRFSAQKRAAGRKGGQRKASREGSRTGSRTGSENVASPDPDPDPSSEPDSDPETEKHTCALSSALDPAQQAIDLWNETAETAGLPKAQRLTDRRRTALHKRLDECGGIEGWSTACEKVRESPFLCGEGDRGWKADIDFMCQAKSFTKLMEGAYDHGLAKRDENPVERVERMRREGYDV